MEENEAATITVLRTTDAMKDEIPIQMSQTLNDLKDAISQSPKFGPLDRNHQRLFHMGRELKTGSRSLRNVGVGKFRTFVVLLYVKPEARHNQNNNKAAAAAGIANNNNNNNNNKRPQTRARQTHSNASSNNSNRAAGQQPTQRANRKKEEAVVELLDSDDDSIEVIENPAQPKRQRQR